MDCNFVTGIVLANASLDVALHDTYYNFCSTNYLNINNMLISIPIINLNPLKLSYNNFKYSTEPSEESLVQHHSMTST